MSQRKLLSAMVVVAALVACNSENPAPTAPNKPKIVVFEPKMVLVPAGTFTMGSDSNPNYIGEDESPAHSVEITKPFLMCDTELTYAQWWSVVSKQAYNKAADTGESIRKTWFEAVEFCNKLSELHGLTPAYEINGETVAWVELSGANGYRLPTEAEWEYACRATTTTDFVGGDIQVWENNCHAEPALDGMGWYCWNYEDRALTEMPVRAKLPNRWGLYDMHGLRPEWCWDWYGSYSAGSAVDPIGPGLGTDPTYPNTRVTRGGEYDYPAIWSRSAARIPREPDFPGGTIRLVRPVTS